MIQKLYANGNSRESLERVANLLKDGGLVVLPTDTLYAVACSALKERAVERVCRLKGLDPAKNNLSVVCYDMSVIGEYAKLDNNAFRLLKRNLPGPFTFVLPASNRLPRIFRQRKEVGFRMPQCSVLSEIAELLDAPLMVTSVPWTEDDDLGYLTEPELIEERLGAQVDLVVDAGTGGAEPSTIVDCTGAEPLVMRQGKGWLDD